jgi:hypothetical protein
VLDAIIARLIKSNRFFADQTSHRPASFSANQHHHAHVVFPLLHHHDPRCRRPAREPARSRLASEARPARSRPNHRYGPACEASFARSRPAREHIWGAATSTNLHRSLQALRTRQRTAAAPTCTRRHNASRARRTAPPPQSPCRT